MPDADGDPIVWLLGSNHAEHFFRTEWERSPLRVPAKSRGAAASDPPLFDRAALLALAPLPDSDDKATMRVVRAAESGKREEPMSSGEDVATCTKSGRSKLTRLATKTWLNKSLQQGFTVQLFSPQQYSNKYSNRIAALISSLEVRFGNLVGCSAYLTPPGCQGLAPHHDDVDVFIVQTQGEKRWKIYTPLARLPREHSEDLERDRLGKAVLDVTLKKGDVLYLPRGWVHEVRAFGGRAFAGRAFGGRAFLGGGRWGLRCSTVCGDRQQER